MKYNQLIAICALSASVVACGWRRTPVPVISENGSVEALVGEWNGEYSSAETGRSGVTGPRASPRAVSAVRGLPCLAEPAGAYQRNALIPVISADICHSRAAASLSTAWASTPRILASGDPGTVASAMSQSSQ